MKRYLSTLFLISAPLCAFDLTLEQAVGCAENVVAVIRATQDEEYPVEKLVMPDITDALTLAADTSSETITISDQAATEAMSTVLEGHGFCEDQLIAHMISQLVPNVSEDVVPNVSEDARIAQELADYDLAQNLTEQQDAHLAQLLQNGQQAPV